MTDKVSEIKRYHKAWSSSAQPKIAGLYQSLAPEEGRELAAYAIELIDRQDEQAHSAEDILLYLACLSPGALDEAYQELVDRQILYPGVVYREAGPGISNQLLNLIPVSQTQADHLLTALAWISDVHVQQAFHQWRKTPPDWAASLYIPPDAYAQVAGWVLTAEAQRQNLFHTQCYPLVKPTGGADQAQSPVQVVQDHKNHCPWCGRQLTTLFDFDLTQPALDFLDIDGRRVRIATCQVCTCYGFVHTKVDWHGAAAWSPYNQRPPYLPDDSSAWLPLPSKRLVLGKTPRNPFNAASDCVPISFSQVGGHPSWIQDFSYPVCPECNNLMVFVAQLANQDIEEYGEGIYYAFLCKGCRNACTCYQQS
jgi:hypothetical protein